MSRMLIIRMARIVDRRPRFKIVAIPLAVPNLHTCMVRVWDQIRDSFEVSYRR
jgi:hypothetical protein